MRVRRSSDNAESDIGFAGAGDLDVTTLLAFTGGDSAFVARWYDQSVNGRNATQTTAAAQPRIVSAGVVDMLNGRPTLIFSGAQTLTCPVAAYINATDGTWTANAVFSTTNTVLGQNFVDSDATGRVAQFLRVGSNSISCIAFNSTNAAFSSSAAGLAANTATVASSVRGLTSVQAHLNGAGGTLVTTSGTPTLQSRALSIGMRLNGTAFFGGSISEVVMVNSALNATERQTLERNQGAYFGISVA